MAVCGAGVVSWRIRGVALGGLLALSGMPVEAQARGAHVHGQAVLEVAQDGGDLVLTVRGPKANLVGFEHAARDAAQRQAMADMARRLREAPQWFLTNPEARCAVTSSEHAIDREGGGHHADVSVTVHFQCKSPEQLSHVVVMPWSAMPHLERLQAVVVAPGGARKLMLARPPAEGQVVLDVRGAR